MTQEIIEAVRDIEREKGIESGALVSALEDALLAAYKKTPGASRHATVEIDEQGDFRVYSSCRPTSRSGCSTRRASAHSRSWSGSRPRTVSALTRCSPTTTSTSTGPTSRRIR
jgi:hypothetical protein